MSPTGDSYSTLSNALTSSFNVPEDEITPQATLQDLQLDSLAQAELLVILQQDFGIQVDISGGHVTRKSTLGELAAALDELRAAGAGAR
ncbi:acyl carrier protein [Streptomyces sp. NPDC101234]|uniref:acyl carrier protein n=1 Tax=Streptomyces sp. NPDC101234 TaxID=3366138 RepID=UPI003826AF45